LWPPKPPNGGRCCKRPISTPIEVWVEHLQFQRQGAFGPLFHEFLAICQRIYSFGCYEFRSVSRFAGTFDGAHSKPVRQFTAMPMPHFVAERALPDDATLVRRIGCGDGQALAALYQRDAPRIHRYCLSMAFDDAMAADAVQDTFVWLAQMARGAQADAAAEAGAQLGRFDASKGTLQGYLMGVARHHVLAALRKSGRFVSASASDDDDAPREPFEAATDAHQALDPLHQQIARQSTQALLAAVAALPLVFREAVVLVDLQEMPYQDAARLAGIPLNTLRTRLHRGRARLAAALQRGGNS
jgi:RNA polymerase sigma-70 factor, ECF subfamily